MSTMNIYWQKLPFWAQPPVFDDGHLIRVFIDDQKTFDEKFVLDFIKAGGDGSFVTLNPMVINFLDDEVAKNIVWVQTSTGFKKLGDIPEIQYKFKALGAGEILCDTDFSKL